jgi:hypothetical protein
MAKRIFTLAILATFILVGVSAAELSKTAPMVNYKQLTGEEPLPQTDVIPYDPGTASDSPGDIVGYTYYDYQTNGSSGNRVAVCPDNSKYFDWMRLFSWPYPPAPRHVFYNWQDPSGAWYNAQEGGQVSENTGSGYTNLDLIEGNIGAMAYHQGDSVIVSIEWGPGLGFFDHFFAPHQVFPQTPESPGICIWPYIAVDQQDFIHIVATENTDRRIQRLGYTRSEDGGVTWTNFQMIDTVQVIGCVIDASPVSNKVAIAYPKTTDTTTQWRNDIVYYVSENGQTWDWRYGRNNVTNYTTDNDSLWAYTDMDVIIDYNDNVNLLWNAQWITADGSIYYRTSLYHYNEDTDQITEILHHPDSLWTDISGAWNRPICKMNMGVMEGTNAIYATWTQFDTSDVSAGGFGNGDLYMSYSENDGATWSAPVNMTDSPSPGCFPGECDSDHWSTLANVVDDNLHVFYTNDKDAGGIPQTEGAATENPMRYLEYPNPLTGIEDNDNRPLSFSLNQNYPNPFNARTVISFNLKIDGPVSVEIFDITGAKVTTLVDGTLTAGQHDITWDASDVASGVYYYRLNADGNSLTKQAVLIK